MVKIKFFLLLPIENHCGQNVEILKLFFCKYNIHHWKAYKKLKYRSLNGYLAFAYPAEVIQDLKCHKFVFCAFFALFFQF
jgi:hypothetical protein